MCLTMTAFLAQAGSITFAPDQKFDVLQTKTTVYKNVTVTKKAKTCIFIRHSSGIVNIQLADLPDDVLETLGYPTAAQQAQASAKVLPAKLSIPSVPPQLAQKVEQAYQKFAPAWAPRITINTGVLLLALGTLIAVYLFFCYCSMLICQKTHTEPGALVWVPALQLFPLLRAAGMSRVWFVAFFVPLLNVVAQIVWYVKIVQARGKSIWVAVLLLLPLSGPFAFLYLAFSSAAPFNIEREVPLALQVA